MGCEMDRFWFWLVVVALVLLQLTAMGVFGGNGHSDDWTCTRGRYGDC